MITHETRRMSYDQIKPKIGKKQQECINGLKVLKEATANELAIYLFRLGLTPFFNRNYVHPRLNELVWHGKVKIIGKRKDSTSGRLSAVYMLEVEK